MALILAFSAAARAQPDDGRLYAEEPTGGLNLPATPLAGDHDALATVANPAGLVFLGGGYMGLALDFAPEDEATSAGPGFGFYAGQTFGGRLFPRMGIGLAGEILRPSRIALSPDPGTPFRLTMASAMALGRSGSLGLSWHRFFDDSGHALAGATSWDLGFAARFGAHWAAGAVVRDLNTPTIADTPVQRRYELELVSRPVGNDRLELAVGGRIGETRSDVDGWLRWSTRLTRGLYFKGAVETRELHIIDQSATGAVDNFDEREYRLSAGFEFSFGAIGASSYASASVDAGGDLRFSGGTFVARVSGEQVPSITGDSSRIERIDLSGPLPLRKHTALVATLRRIARDGAVVALFVRLDGLEAGWASFSELHQELLRVRKAGKKVFVYAVSASTGEYLLASAADKIYIDPAGGLELAGFAATTLYHKAQLDRFKIKAEFEKIEEYKSAPEAFTRTGPSEPALRMRNELYDSIYDSLVGTIASARGLDRAAVKKLIDNGPYTAGDLEKDPRLVDAIATPDELAKLISEELGARYAVDTPPRVRPERWQIPAIAVIHLEGDIISGKSASIPFIGRKLVGSETIAAAIAAARADSRVVAIVLRIDSPGGSAVASELMAREVFATRGVKPIICSMGDVAASGGYFAAAGCDVVFADPMTITGSIGIFYGKFDVSGLFGITGLRFRTLKRGRHADMNSYFRSFTDEERAFLKQRLRYLYGRFVDTVAEGRPLSKDEVDAVGRGRVWSGVDARRVKLVDHLGGVGDAIALAKSRAGLGANQRAALLLLPKPGPGLVQQLLGLPSIAGDENGVVSLDWLPGARAFFNALPASLLVEPEAAQARLPFTIVWE